MSQQASLKQANDLAASLPDTITVGEWTLPLKVKLTTSTTSGIMDVWKDEQTRQYAYGAALGVMWESLGAPHRYPLRAQYRRMGRRWVDYGAAVIDELSTKGVPYDDVMLAGRLAWTALAHQWEKWPKEADVAAHVGNS